MATKKTPEKQKAAHVQDDVQPLVVLDEQGLADRRREAERQQDDSQPSLEERQAMAEQANPPKRAEFYHTDHGYSVTVVDPDRLSGETHKALESLTERIAQLQEDGYVVFLEGSSGELVELAEGGKVKKAE